MAVIRQPVVLPRIALIKLWEWAGYPAHEVIGVNEYWQTPAADQKLETEINAHLLRQGLADGDQPSAELRGTLDVLARAEAECHGWVSNVRARQNGGFVVAELNGYAVRLVRDDDVVRIDPVPAGEVAEAAVQALPRVPPAPIEPFTVEQPVEKADADGPYEVQVKKARSRPSDKARLKEIERGPHTGVNELYVVARVHGGEQTSEPLSVVDLVDGGRVLVTHVVEDGEPRLHCQPGSFENLVAEIQGTWQALVRRVAPART
jgi:hypothetical protein